MVQRLKSAFISLYPVLCVFGLYLAYDQYIHGFIIASIGLLILSSTMLLLLARVFLTDVARTQANLPVPTTIIIVGALVLGYALLIGEAENIAGFGYLLALGWFLYVYWYSRFEERSNELLQIGQLMPSFSLEDEDGSMVSSESLLSKKSIIMFYRGNWCPLCMAQIKELVTDYKTLESKGIQTILISPQPHRNTKSLARKFDVAFKFLVDKGNLVAKKLNIISKNGLPMGMQILGYDSDTVMPTIILTDDNGKIIYSDLTTNYRVRPEPKALIKFFD